MVIKKTFLGLLLSVFIFTSIKTVEASDCFYAETYTERGQAFTVATTTKNMKTYTTDYGLKKGRYVSKVEVYLREGDFYGTNSTSDGTTSVSKWNNPLYVARGWWTWYYK